MKLPLVSILLSALALPGLSACTVTQDAPPITQVVDPLPTPAAPVAPQGPPDYRFLSTPDFLNTDLADTGVPGANSWNETWAEALNIVMDTFKAEAPEDVLVAGDLVNGHWGVDESQSGVFGPVAPGGHSTQALRNAADLYYGTWIERFRERDLTVHAAVGDHEIGDDPWRGAKAAFKRKSVALFKSVFASHIIAPNGYTKHPAGPAARTAYATYLHPEVLLVTVDVFSETGTDVIAELDAQQLAWLDKVLGNADARGTDWIIVQGHTPVVGPVRHWGSSHLMYEGGEDSAFWDTMARHQVDLYLAGEVHDITARQVDGVTQISHGGLFAAAPASGKGSTNYLLGEVRGSEMTLRINRFLPYAVNNKERLWQTAPYGQPPLTKSFLPAPPVVGTMTLTSENQILARSGLLGVYTGK